MHMPDLEIGVSDFLSQFLSDFLHFGIKKRRITFYTIFLIDIDTFPWHQSVKRAIKSLKGILKAVGIDFLAVSIEKPNLVMRVRNICFDTFFDTS